LFIKLRNNNESITGDNISEIKSLIKTNCSPRHVPTIILPINDIPYTINGKKVEVAVKKVIDGEKVTNKDALANPDSLELYKNIPELSR